MKAITLKKGERVVCFACGRPIKVKEWGGVVNTSQGQAYTHDNVLCLMAFADLCEALSDALDSDTEGAKSSENKTLRKLAQGTLPERGTE